jgi:hypothetical protein
VQLRNAMEQHQQQQQLGQLQIQQQQLQLQDEQKLRELSPQFVTKHDSGKVTGYDFDGYIRQAAASGVSQRTLSQMQLQRAEVTSKLSSAEETVRNNEIAKNKMLYEELEGVRGITDLAQRQQQYQRSLGRAQSFGMDTSKWPQQVPDNDHLTGFEAELGMHGQILADAKEQADTAEKNATTRKTLSEIGTTAPLPQNIAVAAGVPERAGQPVTLAQLKAYREAVDQGNKIVSANGRQLMVDPTGKVIKDLGTAPAVTTFNLQNALPKGEGGQPSELAQMVASGQMKWNDAVSPRWPLSTKAAFAAQVKAINPNFNSGDFDVEKKVREKYTSGNAGNGNASPATRK